MKSRLILTSILLAFGYFANRLFDLYYSPMTGAITANTLNGDANDYVFAKFVQNDGMTGIFGLIILIGIVLIWWNFLFGKNKNK